MTARVLVVDDIPANIKLLEAKLTAEYYDVLVAKNGLEALEVVKQNPPDIILLDVMMPELDGFETCQRLKADPEVSHIPVVMVTALSEAEDRVKGLKVGADDFLTKPINDVALFARIRSLVRLKMMMDELRLRDQTGGQLGAMSLEEHEQINTDNAHILVVDDDVAQSQRLSSKLSEIDCKVEIEKDPNVAIEKANNEPFDLIIVSTQLLDADGLRLCSHLRSNEKIRHTPLLILVEEEDTKLLVKGLDMGVNDYLVMPVDMNELIARVGTQVRRKRYQDALRSNYKRSMSMAITDGLTGLYNRRYFDAHFQTLFNKALETGKQLTLMMTDIDHFKKINDTHGHLVGDEILRKVPERLTQNLRVTDLVARYGGEEFVIVMPDTALPGAEQIAERIRIAVAATSFKINEGASELPCTISIGMTGMKPGDTPEMLIKRADKGLYLSKEQGRNLVTVYDGDDIPL